jgi:hypothetical protein
MRAPASTWDGRWVALALLGVYYATLFLTGSGSELAARWRLAGVYAHPVPFIDLQVFPAARATLAAGQELYGPSVADPLRRPYNYPRLWLAFMRFPADKGMLCVTGVLMAVVATGSVLLFWGRLTPATGVWGGLLLCSPAFQLGVERGNTDLLLLTLVAAGAWLAGDRGGWRAARALWWIAGVLKLYPVVALAADLDGGWRAWIRRTWLPLVLFAGYLAVSWCDLPAVLHNTGGGWVQSYGSEVPAAAWAQVQAFYHGAASENFKGIGRALAVLAALGMLIRGWRAGAAKMAPEPTRALLGFRAGALIYLGTFIAGSSFDYRQGFLLLTLPQLLAWQRGGHRWAAAALVALLPSLGLNYLLGGWPGFFLNEAAGWFLVPVLAFLLGASWRRAAPAAG